MAMNTANFGLALLFAGAAATAHAHSQLRSSTPAEASTIAPPSQVVLGFSEISQLTALTLMQGSAPALKIVPLPERPAQQLRVGLPKLTPGAWSLTWRVIGSDGHITHGTVHFTVK
jgi:methionine-rich copper-binding protein CopC